jgi:hypothetical protein
MLNVSNYYERLVIDRLWQITEKAAEPATQTFLEDVACLALNQLPPCYVRFPVDKGADLSDRQYQDMVAAVDVAVGQAMERVRSRPHDVRNG